MGPAKVGLLVAMAAAAVSLAATDAPGGGETAYVSETGTSLRQALEDQRVTHIVLNGDYSIANTQEFDSLPRDSPVPIDRNLTITSASGAWPTLDMDYAFQIIKVCSTCTLKFQGNLTIANDRRGTNPTYDFVVGEQGSRVWCSSVYRHRLACTQAKEAAETILRMPRSSAWPNANASQSMEIKDVVYKGKLYPASLYVRDATFDVPLQHIEGRGFMGGYSQNCHDVVRLCEAYVSAECLRNDGPEACVNQLIDDMRRQAASAPGPSPGLLGGVVAAAVIVAVALLFVGLMFFRRKRKRQQEQKQQEDQAEHGSCSDNGTTDSELGTQMSQFGRSGKSISGGSGSQVGSLPKGQGKDWEVISCFSNPIHPEFNTNSEDNIQLGEFIGAGSFGKVYQAEFCGHHVAVKVVEHTQAASAAVQNEMTLQMSFNSPYIVAAYKCITYGKAPSAINNRSSSCRCDSASTEATADSASQRDINSSSGTASGMQTSSATSAARERPMELATWLVQEYCDQGTLKGFVIKSGLPARLKAGDPDAMSRLLLLLQQAAMGLQTLHAGNVVHGDLNCRNCLVASNKGTRYGVEAKVADLGISRALQQHKTHRTTQNIGTITHSAPELLRFGRMSPASDVFSFGVMMWALYTGQEPYGKLLYGQFFETVVVNDLRPVIPPDMPELFSRLMEHCWSTTPEERPTVKQLLQALEFLQEHLPRQMAAGTAVLEGDCSTVSGADAVAVTEADDLELPEVLRRPPSRHEQRQKQLQQMAAAAVSAADMCDGRSNSNMLLPASEVMHVVTIGTASSVQSGQQGSLLPSPQQSGRVGPTSQQTRLQAPTSPAAGMQESTFSTADSAQRTVGRQQWFV